MVRNLKLKKNYGTNTVFDVLLKIQIQLFILGHILLFNNKYYYKTYPTKFHRANHNLFEKVEMEHLPLKECRQ